MSVLRQRAVHIIRHAESELNVISSHANAGYFEGVTTLDSKLSKRGYEQASELNKRILNESTSDPYLLRQAQCVVTSPLSRSILTSTIAMPVSNYNYFVKEYIAEQVENTTDIGHQPFKLSKMYPELSNEFNNIPNIWWYQNSNHKNLNHIENINELDAKLLIENKGKTPFSESKYNLRKRALKFIKWIYSDDVLVDKFNNNKELRMNELYNIAAFSHACTIRELELLFKTLTNDISEEEAMNWSNEDWIRNNTEQITFNIPSKSTDVNWELLETRVELAKDVPNHADLELIE